MDRARRPPARRARRLVALPALLALLAPAACGEAPLGPPGGEVRWSLLAVGDLGSPPRDDPRGRRLAVGRGLADAHRLRPADALALLGDNFYPDGLEAHELVERVRENVVRPLCPFLRLDGPRSAEVAEACPAPEAARRPVPLHVVLGNHDHLAEGSARRQREVVPRFVPNWSVPDGHARVVETGAGVSLVLLDSQKVFQRPEERMGALREALARSRGPWRIVVAHHPPLVLDLDEAEHELRWTERAVAGARAALAEAGVPVHVWLAGHEHSLQLVPGRAGEPAVVAIAGSGSEPREPDVRPGTAFVSASPGFARVDLVATPEGERLAVTLYEVADDDARQGPRARARAWVAPDGRVHVGEDPASGI